MTNRAALALPVKRDRQGALGLPRLGLRAIPVLIESEPELWIFVLTRFLHANRSPLRSKTL
jgi:hypothetical protein